MITPWLKKNSPPPGPPVPEKVDQIALLEALAKNQAVGQTTPAAEYLYANTPAAALDDWGDPLPLSATEQDSLDRLVAIMASPLERGWALVQSGQLVDDEVAALIGGFPDIYAILTTRVRGDMLVHPHPYPQWAESVIATLFCKPAALVLSPPAEQGAEKPPKTGKPITPPPATQADRREPAVRAERT